MIRGTGKRRAGADNKVLRAKVANLTDDVDWYRRSLKRVTARCRALTAQVEISDGERLLDQQLIHQQTARLDALNAENEQLRQQLQAVTDDTVETPVVTAAQLAAA